MMHFQYMSVLLTIVVISYSASALEFQDCGSKKGSFSSVKITGCDPASMDFCPLKKNENVTIELDFTPNEDVTSVKAKVYGYLSIIPTPFLLPNADGCKDSGLTCPLAKGSSNKYILTLPIKSVYPKIKVNVELLLRDSAREDIVCVMIPAQIV